MSILIMLLIVYYVMQLFCMSVDISHNEIKTKRKFFWWITPFYPPISGLIRWYKSLK